MGNSIHFLLLFLIIWVKTNCVSLINVLSVWHGHESALTWSWKCIYDIVFMKIHSIVSTHIVANSVVWRHVFINIFIYMWLVLFESFLVCVQTVLLYFLLILLFCMAFISIWKWNCVCSYWRKCVHTIFWLNFWSHWLCKKSKYILRYFILKSVLWGENKL